MLQSDEKTDALSPPNDPAASADRIAQAVRQFSTDQETDVIALLGMLRLLEQLHREIVEGTFRKALPSNRQALYRLLRDMETQGGWPYIPRLRLQTLRTWLEDQQDPAADQP